MDDAQEDFFEVPSELECARYLLAELNEDLSERVGRLRLLNDFRSEMGEHGAMIYGGTAAHMAWVEAQSCFVSGNFVATIVLCQSHIENLLAAFLHTAQLSGSTSGRASLKQTLATCADKGIVSQDQVSEIKKLMSLRNPISHHRPFDDPENVDRKAADLGLAPMDLLERDAKFAIQLASMILSRKPFRVG